MIRKALLPALILVFFAVLSVFGQAAADKEEKMTMEFLDGRQAQFAGMAQQIWEWAELGYQEYKSSGLLQEALKKEGFLVQAGVAEIPTAFVATFGSGKPVIGILAEFDALPGVSQDKVPFRQEREGCTAGHACGHHLFGTASAAAAIAVKKWLQDNKLSGTVRLYGCPAEEGGGGKVYLVRAGLFDDVDAVLHWHPGNSNSAVAGSSLANKSAKFRFYGNASHAAASPWNGRSALDGVEAMDMMVNMMREHVPQEARIHYVITKGGEAPNVVPEFAEVFYYVRHPEMEQVKAIFERVVKAAEGAALGTGTRMDYEVIHGIYNLLPNRTLGEVIYHKLEKVGGVVYTEEEKAFAEKIMTTYNPAGATIASAAEVKPFSVEDKGVGGSTDVGDVSWAVPTAGMTAATWAPGTSAHSWQAVAAGGTGIGTKGMMVAAKTLALSAMELIRHPELNDKAKTELLERRGDNFKYESLLGDRKPPLDYRN
ncbi:MAG TPA: amidohydrolase [Flavilitoribacter sp.]|nr:amidohydrolase [Flavilitoribacter sp.]HMQ88573.1 amidohydrolase [Flavilitoribacter sp.]